MSTININVIKEQLPEGWQLISDTYKNLKEQMEFECPRGHRIFNTWDKMRNKCECPSCKSFDALGANTETLAKPVGTKRILAIDQATHVTGYAIFDNGNLVKYGTFSARGTAEIDRIASARDWLLSMIGIWRPDSIAVEGIQFQDKSEGNVMGVTVFQALARLQGVLMMVCYDAKIQCEVCPTNTWRHSCGVKGTSRSERKASTRRLVKGWYNVDVSEDEADAIGIGRYMSTIVQKSTTIMDWET